jgi:hypothetical protein
VSKKLAIPLGEVHYGYMPLKDHFAKVVMTYACPHCEHPLTKQGSWFKTMRHYNCASCREVVTMTYPAKVALFALYDQAEA